MPADVAKALKQREAENQAHQESNETGTSATVNRLLFLTQLAVETRYVPPALRQLQVQAHDPVAKLAKGLLNRYNASRGETIFAYSTLCIESTRTICRKW